MSKRILAAFLFAVMPLCMAAAKEKPRPKILGIAQVRILTTDEKKAENFYYGIMRVLASMDTTTQPCDWCERMPSNGAGPIAFDQIRGGVPTNLIASITLRTDNVEGLRDLLKMNKIPVGKITKGGAAESFIVLDPERHQLIFSQIIKSKIPSTVHGAGLPGAYGPSASWWPHIIHAGFVVKNRSEMDKFYRDILGFHVYWTGGMKDGETDWVDMQVPDGTDWIEYMLNVPDDADRRRRGVMNHIALGVQNVREADQRLLESDARLPINGEPKVGRDGKWQLNLYDPDGTRVELMEFTPTDRPCCSEYSGPHPTR